MVQQRRDAPRSGLPTHLRGPGALAGRLGAQQARPPDAQGRWAAEEPPDDLLEPEDAFDHGLLRAVDLRLREPHQRPAAGAHPRRPAEVAHQRQGHERHVERQLGRRPGRRAGAAAARRRAPRGRSTSVRRTASSWSTRTRAAGGASASPAARTRRSTSTTRPARPRSARSPALQHPARAARRSPRAPRTTGTDPRAGRTRTATCRHPRGTTGCRRPATHLPRSPRPRWSVPARSVSRTRARPPDEATAPPATSSATCRSTPSSTPLACPSTPPRSRCCDDQLNPPWVPWSEWTTHPVTDARPPRRATAEFRASTASWAFIRSLIEYPTIRLENTSLTAQQ